MYYGTESGRYTAFIDVGNVSHCGVSGLASGLTHHFATTAYNINGQESPYSNEVFKFVEARTGAVRVDIIPQEAVTAGARWQLDGGV